jgi:hypothetical protein
MAFCGFQGGTPRIIGSEPKANEGTTGKISALLNGPAGIPPAGRTDRAGRPEARRFLLILWEKIVLA